MKLPIAPSLDRQDFPEAPDWLSKLLYPIRLFMTSVYNALSNNLSLQDNVSCVIRKFSLTAGAADTDNVFTFPCNLGREIVEVNITASNLDGTYTPVYPQVSFNFINGNVVINGIKGLTATKQYSLIVTVK